MLNFMLLVPGADTRDISTLRAIISGASPVPVALIERYFEIGIEIQQVYGLTESGGPGCYLGSADALARAGSTGRGYLLTDVRVIDADGNDVPPGEPGQVLLRGDHNMIGYWNRPEATAETLQHGWLHTGDVAIRDEDGFVTIHDRIKDVVISGGENVYPAEVENVLLQHPDISDVAVIGQESATWGECVFAVVVSASETLQRSGCPGLLRRQNGPLQDAEGRGIRCRDPAQPHGQTAQTGAARAVPGPRPRLEHRSLIWDHLTGFSRLLARQGSRRGLGDHKWALTTSSGREKPAFGGPNQPTGVVAKLARCPTSRRALRLAG